MKQLQAIIPIYVDNIGNAVEPYYNDTTTIKYYLLECCIKKCKKWTHWLGRNMNNNQENIEDKIQKARLSRLLIDDYNSKLNI